MYGNNYKPKLFRARLKAQYLKRNKELPILLFNDVKMIKFTKCSSNLS